MDDRYSVGTSGEREFVVVGKEKTGKVSVRGRERGRTAGKMGRKGGSKNRKGIIVGKSGCENRGNGEKYKHVGKEEGRS